MKSKPSPLPEPTKQDTDIHISEYLNVLYKRKRFIFLFSLLFLIVVAYRTFTVVPLYESDAELVIEAKSLDSPITGRRLAYETNVSQMLDMGTHFRLIKSKPVIKSVIASLKLSQRPEKRKAPGLIRVLSEKARTLIRFGITKLFPLKRGTVSDKVLDPATQKENRLIKRIQKGILLTQVKKTRLIRISVRNPEPELAAGIANTLAQNYIEYDRDNRVASSQKDLTWLNTELHDLKRELEANERAFYQYKTQHKVFSLEGKQKVTGQKIAEFNTRYLEARNKRMDMDSKINEIRRHMKTPKELVKVSSLIHNELIAEIYNKIGDLEVEQTKLSKFYKPRHPKIIQVKSEIEKNQRRLDFELQKELANLKSERSVLADREKALSQTVSEFEQDALDSSSNELTYSILQRNVATSQKLYDILLARIKESDILKNNASSNIRIVDHADIPSRPVYPKTLRNLVLGVIFGLTGGCLMAFFFEYMDQTLRTREDVQSYLDIPVLSIIPESDAS